MRTLPQAVHTAIILIAILSTPPAHAAIIHVPADYPTIQAAVSAAVTGDEIIVAPGTYVLVGTQVIAINSKTIAVRSSGGAAATTIQGGGVFPIFHLGVNNTTIQGFTITGGRQFNPFTAGGISINAGNPTILDCIFTDNHADAITGAPAGGAIGSGVQTSCTVSGCTFLDNQAGNGGAGAIYMSLSLTISDCTFQNNTSIGGTGGAVRAVIGSMSDCTFIGNTATSSGGALHASGPFTITNCTFESNTSGGSGGGARLDQYQSNPPQSSTISGCTFTGNSAASGGGLTIFGGQVTGCTFDDNAATGNGGGLHVAGTSPVVTQATFRANTAGGTGGGLYVPSGVTATLTEATFCQNLPNEYFSAGVLVASNVVIAAGGADCDAIITVLGACCLPQGGCVITSETSCVAAKGTYQGNATACDKAGCPGPSCVADIAPPGGDGAVNVDDLIAVILGWGTCP